MTIDPREWDALHDAARESLSVFARLAWPELNRGTPIIWSWHNDAVAEHLTAVSRGELRKLIICVPPGSSKTTITAQAWPAWDWLQSPHKRWGFAAYAGDLSKRDSVKRRDLINSNWFREAFRPAWQLKGDESLKMVFANTVGGEMRSMSVGGAATGFHFDFLVCFPADEMVWTEFGRIPIGRIVRERLPVRVWSFDAQTNEMSLQPVENWVTNSGDEIVEVWLSDGTVFRCTPTHEVWTSNRAWVRARELVPTDVLPRPVLPDRPDDVGVDAVPLRHDVVVLRSVQDLPDHGLGQLGARGAFAANEVVLAPVAICRRAPGAALADLLDDHTADPVPGGKHVSLFDAASDFDGDIPGELGAGAPLHDRKRPVALGVSDVLGARAVDEVIQARVGAVPVQVPDLHAIGPRADKREHHPEMHRLDGRPAIGAQPDVRVPLVDGTLQDDAGLHVGAPTAPVDDNPLLASDPSGVRHAVVGKPGDRTPLLVRHVGFAAETFCLTVAHNHTFVVGGGRGVIVANCDDPLKAMDIYTARLAQSVQWYEEQWASRMRDPEKSAQVIIAQRLHDRDLPGVKMLDGTWTVLRIPMEYEKRHHCVTRIGWEDPRTEDGEPLCPQRFSAEFIAEKKRNARVWAAQYQQRPQVGDGTIVKSSWFRFYYLDKPIDGAIPYPGDDAMEKWLGSWDMTFDGGAKADYVVGQVWAKKGPVVYLRDQVRDQMRFTEQRRAALRLGRKWPEVRRWLIENKANGAAIIDTLRRPLSHEEGGETDDNGLPGVIPINPKEPKVARLEAVATYFEAGNVVLPHPDIAPWVPAFIDEMVSFPTGANDDQCDAAAQALKDIFRSSLVTEAEYDALLGKPSTIPDRLPDGEITDPRDAQRAIDEAASEAAMEEREKRRERERIAARLGFELLPGQAFSTRDFGRK